MKRRNVLVGMGGLAAGSGALVGSGAFSSVEADRGVAIAVVDDPDAYLGLEGCPDSPNGQYARIQSDGTMALDLSPSNDEIEGGGEGVNPEAQTVIRDVFQIRNQGTQEVAVWIDVDSVEDDAGDPRVEFYLYDEELNEGENDDIVGYDNRVCLDVGDAVCVSMDIDTRGLGSDFENDDGENNLLKTLEDRDFEMEINARADECPVRPEPEPVNFPETVSMAYEDLPPDGSNDYDYNDWVVDAEIEGKGTLVEDGEMAEIDEITMELIPKAAGGGDDQQWYIVPGSELGEDIEYTLDVNGDSSSGIVDGEEFFYSDIQANLENGGIDDFKDELDNEDNAIHIFDSDDAFDEGEIINSEPEDDDDCVEPDVTATLTFELDEPWVVDPDDPIDELDEHGTGLFFNPVAVSKNESAGRNRYPVSAGDFRLLTVPTDWEWPYEGVHLADAYDGVGPEDAGDGDVPEFDADWFENPVEGEVFKACRE